MGWKKLPYWLKGGIIGLIIFVVFYLLFIASMSRYACTGYDSPLPKNCTNVDILKTFFNLTLTLPFTAWQIFTLFISVLLFTLFAVIIIGLIFTKIRRKLK